MIPKLICWLFGHKRTTWSFKEHTEDGDFIRELLYYKVCPRCGEELK